MKKIAYILLFISAGLTAQYRVTYNGLQVNAGGMVKSAGVPTYTDEEKVILWQTDFESNTVGDYDTATAFNNDFTFEATSGIRGNAPNPAGDWAYVGRTNIVENYNCDEKLLYIRIPQYSYWDGMQVKMTLPSTDEYYMEYDVAMRPGWTTLETGKLWGFAGYGRDSLWSDYAAGGNDWDAASSSVSTHAGFSTRNTWNRGAAHYASGFGIYAYFKNRVGLWGVPEKYPQNQSCVTDVDDTQTTDWSGTPGDPHPAYNLRYDWWDPTDNDTVWIKVTQRVFLNSVPTPGNPTADGGLEVWIDGILRYRRTNIIYRYYTDIQIDMALFTVFYGGTNANYPTRDEWILKDNAAIYTIPGHAGVASANDRTITPVYPYK